MVAMEEKPSPARQKNIPPLRDLTVASSVKRSPDWSKTKMFDLASCSTSLTEPSDGPAVRFRNTWYKISAQWRGLAVLLVLLEQEQPGILAHISPQTRTAKGSRQWLALTPEEVYYKKVPVNVKHYFITKILGGFCLDRNISWNVAKEQVLFALEKARVSQSEFQWSAACNSAWT